VQLKITAAKDADLGEYKIFVKGTQDTGEATSTEITVKVVAPWSPGSRVGWGYCPTGMN